MTLFNVGEQFNELVKVTHSEKQMMTDPTNNNVQLIDESAKSQDFFQDNNPPGKKYTTTRIKSRKLLLNIAYVGKIKEDFYNKNFILDVYLLATKNINPFSLDRKLADKNKHEMIYMLWKDCIPHKFYQHVCEEKIFVYLNDKNVLQPKVVEIITYFMQESEENYKDLRNNLPSYKTIFQYVYSNDFPEIYCSTKRRGFDLKSNFHIMFKTYKDKKKLEVSLGKNPNNYGEIRNETSVYEQKPIKTHDFNEIEEKQVKEWVENRKQKRREVAENNKLLKKKEKRGGR